MQPDYVLSNFCIKYDNYKLTSIKQGNINNTYLLETQFNTQNEKYVLQRINKQVFTKPYRIMQNVSKILDYLNNKELYYLKTLTGKSFFIDESGEFWRMYNYVKESISFNYTKDLNVIYNVGLAYGEFLKSLINFKVNILKITIPDFHNTLKRYENLQNLVFFNNERFKRAETEYNKLIALKNSACLLELMATENLLPKRVVHNDTKCSNVLLNEKTLKPITVIDLDTVMPGLIAYDFGDGARSICASSDEESNDFNHVYFDLNKFKAYSSGFLSPLKNLISDIEKRTLYLGVFSMTVELAVRFLTDYFQNDIYFKISYPENNYVRAINQLTLAKDLLQKQDEIKQITYDILFAQ